MRGKRRRRFQKKAKAHDYLAEGKGHGNRAHRNGPKAADKIGGLKQAIQRVDEHADHGWEAQGQKGP